MDCIELLPYGPRNDHFYIGLHHPLHHHDHVPDSIKRSNQYGLFLSAGITACITSSVYNPLDCLRVRWQTLPTSNSLSSSGIIKFTAHILRQEGLVNGLWRPGIIANAVGMGSSAALRFGFYENVRDAMQRNIGRNEINEKRGIYMFLAGLSCGAFAYFVTSPFHLMKTRIQAERNNFMNRNSSSTSKEGSQLTRILLLVKEQGIRGLWNGSSPVAARGALFTAGQMLGYDGCKTVFKTSGVINDGVKLHILSSIVAAFGATLLSTPADYVMARYVSSNSFDSISKCIAEIYREHGIIGFWRGSGICFVRVCPVMLSYTTIYEQLRHNFGLGFLT